MDYKIKLEQFEGPLDLLLKLIEEEELDISRISLSKITDQYLSYIQQEKFLNPDKLADFLVIAAKLILIKSKILLPNIDLEEEEEGIDLEKQLKIYRQYLEASKKIRKVILQKRFTFAREYLVKVKGFYPPKKVNKGILAQAFQEVLKKIEPIIRLPQKTIKKIISLQQKIKDIRNLISRHKSLGFNSLLKNKFSCSEIIITFLAILELNKQQLVEVIQENFFEEIEIHHH